MAIKSQIEFYKRTDAIALNLRQLDPDTIHTIAEALEREYKAIFNKRFRKVEFLTRAGLV